MPTLTDLEDRKDVINNLNKTYHNEFYMLYGKEISYFTLFRIKEANYFADDVIDCIKNVGEVKAIDATEDNDAVEVWVIVDDEPTCMYLFPYDMGVVQVGE